jgi:hypothetical protein
MVLPARKGLPWRTWGWAAAFGLLALSVFPALTPELVRGVQGWPANANCFPPVAGPGDDVRVYLPIWVDSVKGYWRGSPKVVVSNWQELGLADKPLKAHSSREQWGQSIERGKGETASKSSRLWTTIHLPEEPTLAGKELALSIQLKVTYPAPMGQNGFQETMADYADDSARLRLAATPAAGFVYLSCWWLGIGGGAFLASFMSLALTLLASGSKK